jgi:hypothetical protein
MNETGSRGAQISRDWHEDIRLMKQVPVRSVPRVTQLLRIPSISPARAFPFC